MKKSMDLSGRKCLVCGKPSSNVDPGRLLSDKQKVFFGVPDRRNVCYTLCHDHALEIFGISHPSGLPQGPLLEEALKNAIESFDFSAEEKAEKAFRAEISNKIEMARLLISGWQYQDAVDLLNRAIDDFNREFGPQRTGELEVAWSLLAETCSRLEKFGQSESAYRRLLTIREGSQGPESAGVADALYGLALALVGVGSEKKFDNLTSSLVDSKRFPEAAPILKRCLAILEKVNGDAARKADVLHLSGVISIKSEKFSEAKAFFDRETAIRNGLQAPKAIKKVKQDPKPEENRA